MTVGILPITGNNIGSLVNALSCEPLIVENIADLDKTDKLILPGVGNALAVRNAIQKWRSPLANYKRPVLGICLGMQILFDNLLEGGCTGFQFLPGDVERIPGSKSSPVPNMGWHTVEATRSSRLLKEVQDQSFYFVHSFGVKANDTNCTSFIEYNSRWVSSVERENFYGVQFHPEKSGEAGTQVLNNFLEI